MLRVFTNTYILHQIEIVKDMLFQLYKKEVRETAH